ncbi:MAG: response regulator transcription factor [Bacteroidetes bacterium]|nr:response regulator transcription factor [Bacteroidota bacterium]MBU1720775.1 response regulator transcription factor [Bacteroidota bacterium]
MEKIKVLIADDHQIFRAGLLVLLREIPDVEIIGEASNGAEALTMIEYNMPHVILMDIKMPKMNGIETTKEVKLRYPEIKVLALSMHDEEEYLDAMLFAGAKGFLLKKVELDELDRAIHSVANGKNYFSEELVAILLNKVVLPNDNMQGEPLELSKREKEVLEHICQGLTNTEIGEKLFLSPRTIETHRANLLEKTQSKNTVSLVLFAIKHKLVKV